LPPQNCSASMARSRVGGQNWRTELGLLFVPLVLPYPPFSFVPFAAFLHRADNRLLLAPIFDSWLCHRIHFLLCDILCHDCSRRAFQFHKYLGSNQEYTNSES
jgi:hypothetical protein